MMAGWLPVETGGTQIIRTLVAESLVRLGPACDSFPVLFYVSFGGLNAYRAGLAVCFSGPYGSVGGNRRWNWHVWTG